MEYNGGRRRKMEHVENLEVVEAAGREGGEREEGEAVAAVATLMLGHCFVLTIIQWERHHFPDLMFTA